MAPQRGHQVQVGTYLSPEMFAELKRISAKTRVPMAVYVREAIDAMLKKHRRKEKP